MGLSISYVCRSEDEDYKHLFIQFPFVEYVWKEVSITINSSFNSKKPSVTLYLRDWYGLSHLMQS
jgi:hypothetical protein